MASKPSGTTAVSGQTITSAGYNSVVNDLYDILNGFRPAWGGGDVSTAALMRAALDLEVGVDVQAYDADLAALATAFTRATASGPASLDFAEDTDNGTSRVRIIAPAALAADQVLTLPDATDTLAALAATQTLTNKTLTSPAINTPTLVLKQSAAPTPTAEGDMQWDTDDNILVIGDGASQQRFYPVTSGTFTPTITFGGASVGNVYSTQIGIWTKVGNKVTVEIGIVLSTKGSSTGSARIAGLPFANKTGGRGALAPGFCVGLSSLTAGISYAINSAATVVDIQVPGSTGSGTAATHANFNSGTEIQACGSYLTD